MYTYPHGRRTQRSAPHVSDTIRDVGIIGPVNVVALSSSVFDVDGELANALRIEFLAQCLIC